MIDGGLAELADAIRGRKVSSSEAVADCLARIERLDGRLRAFITLDAEGALRAARALDQEAAAGRWRGLLHGVPLAYKDLCHIEGTLTSCGTKTAGYFASERECTAVSRLRAAGAVTLGKLNMTELALGPFGDNAHHGHAQNPWRPGHAAGGSSSGSGVSVAAGLAWGALGTDTGGSIRLPAACCGIVGLKPTRGRNTMAPYAGEGLGGCSTEHAVTLSVRDSAALLDATAGPGPGDPYAAPPPARPFLDEVGADPGALRIAYTTAAPNGAPVAAESLRALSETVGLCVELGHRVEAADPDIDRALVVPTFLTLAAANTVVNLGGHPTAGRPPRPDEVERVTWGTAQKGERVSAADYVRATQAAHRLGRQMAAFHATYHVLLTPGLATLPVELGWIDMMMEDVDEYWRRVFTFSPFTVWFNLTGQPAVTLPLGRAGGGLPVAVQLAARYGDEATLFRLAAQLERARPWFDHRPAIAS
jgi:Asp-tRNA(Asn)/Glu-tRNA(Gln) amidotransferase A subunit family amidase